MMKIKLPAVLIPLCLLFLSSCLTSASVEPQDAASSSDVPGSEREEVSDKEPSYPEAVEVSGNIDFTSDKYSYMWDTAPVNGRLRFFASASRKAYREQEIDYAVMDAARQASMLFGVRVNARFAVKSNSRDLGFLEDIDVSYDRNLAASLVTKIKVLDHFRDNEGTYIMAELDGVDFSGSFRTARTEDNEPEWLYEIPEIEGYSVTLGAVQRSRYLPDSVRKADEQTLANVAKQISVEVKNKRTNLESGSQTGYNEINYEVASAVVDGFYVLGRWSEDNGNVFYTLAVRLTGM